MNQLDLAFNKVKPKDRTGQFRIELGCVRLINKIFWLDGSRASFFVLISIFFTDKLPLEHVGLPHVLALAVHLVNFFGWMSQGGHSEQLLFFALFYQSTPSCLKVMGGNEQSGMLV